MRRGQTLLLFALSVFLLLPILGTASSENLRQEDIRMAVFFFYPISVFGIYLSILCAFVLRVKVETDRVIIIKWILIPLRIHVRRNAIRSIRITKRMHVPTSGKLKGVPFEESIVAVHLMNGKTVRNSLPYVSLADTLAIQYFNATWRLPVPGVKRGRNVRYRLHITVFVFQLALIAGGFLLNRYLYSLLT